MDVRTHSKCSYFAFLYLIYAIFVYENKDKYITDSDLHLSDAQPCVFTPTKKE